LQYWSKNDLISLRFTYDAYANYLLTVALGIPHHFVVQSCMRRSKDVQISQGSYANEAKRLFIHALGKMTKKKEHLATLYILNKL